MLRRSILICLSALIATPAPAKDKKKTALPAQVLNARTVLVVVKPGAGEPLTSPGANQNAQGNVEKALMKVGALHSCARAHDYRSDYCGSEGYRARRQSDGDRRPD